MKIGTVAGKEENSLKINGNVFAILYEVLPHAKGESMNAGPMLSNLSLAPSVVQEGKILSIPVACSRTNEQLQLFNADMSSR